MTSSRSKKIKPAKSSAQRTNTAPPGIPNAEKTLHNEEELNLRTKQLLKDRAMALAEEQTQEDEKLEHIEVVEFVLSWEHYGIDSSFIREVYPLKEFTPVPCTPDFVIGITNIRGQILSVIDIKKFFGLPDKGLTDLNRVIIVEAPRMELGILADRINGIRRIRCQDLQSQLPTLTGIRADFLRGVTEDRMVVLDVEKILNDSKIIVHEEVDV